MVLLALGLGVPAALISKSEKKPKTRPDQEASRLVRVPTEVARLVLVPPCGTGVNVATIKPAALAETPGTVRIRMKKGRGDRLVLVPRCQAAEGAEVSEGVNLPSAAFVLPVGARITAGRGGSAVAGTELVQSQLVIPRNSGIRTVVVPGCTEQENEAKAHATGRTLILDLQRGRLATALGPPF